MTGSEIKAIVDTFVGETIDDADAKTGINEGISKMGPIVEDSVASTAYVKDTWYNLPASCIKVTEVNLNDTYNTGYLDYRISPCGEQILFGDDDEYIIHYLREPAALTVITGTPEMHVAYHKCLVTFLKGWFKYKEAIDNDEKAEGLKFMENDFEKEVARVRRSLKSGNPSQMIAQRSV